MAKANPSAVAAAAYIKKPLEAAKLKQENEQLRQFINKIPPEIRREMQQRYRPQKGRAERD